MGVYRKAGAGNSMPPGGREKARRVRDRTGSGRNGSISRQNSERRARVAEVLVCVPVPCHTPILA